MWGFLLMLFHLLCFFPVSNSILLGAGLPTPSKRATEGLPPASGDVRSVRWLGQETGHSAFSDRL
jgi:hypothetical protein